LHSSDLPSQRSHSTGIDRTGAINGDGVLSQQAFDKLLNRFSTNREAAGIEYETTRQKLVRFFLSRSIDLADVYADETINRVARRIDEGQDIDNLRGYFYGVAQLVFKEILKDKDRAAVPIEDAPPQRLAQKAPEQKDPDLRLQCFDRCLESLPPESRQLILEYYEEEGRAKIVRRQQLADRLRIPLNALRIRAHRIRVGLEECIQSCLQEYVGQK
jgi:DNA-directed RNA polymerase specialized sigma24 family protein